jgi:branched-chain amino acid transport system ATP-binding protein
MLLKTNRISAGYGKKQVLFNVSIQVADGDIVSVIGPNGSGKSTLLKVISGMISAWEGDIFFKDEAITRNSAPDNVRAGLVYSPQGHLVFKDLSVFDNLRLGASWLPKKDCLAVFDLIMDSFPTLKGRLKQIAGSLSGGEQQMVSFARVLIGQPTMLLLDEPSLGLSPQLIATCFEMISQFVDRYGLSILIVEQKVRRVLELSNRTYGLSLGRVVYEGESKELIDDSSALSNIFL